MTALDTVKNRSKEITAKRRPRLPHVYCMSEMYSYLVKYRCTLPLTYIRDFTHQLGNNRPKVLSELSTMDFLWTMSGVLEVSWSTVLRGWMMPCWERGHGDDWDRSRIDVVLECVLGKKLYRWYIVFDLTHWCLFLKLHSWFLKNQNLNILQIFF